MEEDNGSKSEIEYKRQYSALVSHLTPDEILKRWRKCQQLEEARYWHVIWLLTTGMSAAKVSQIIGLPLSKLRAICNRYNEEGSVKVPIRKPQKPGQQLKILTPEVEHELRVVLQQLASDGKPWSSSKVASWLSARIGRRIASSVGWRCLRKLGYYAIEDEN